MKNCFLALASLVIGALMMFQCSSAHAAVALDAQSMLSALVYLVIIGVIFWVIWWFIGYVGVPEPFNKVLRVIVGLCALIIVINVLLGIAGQPLFSFRH